VRELLGRFQNDRYQIVLGALTDIDALSLPEGTTLSQEDGATILTAGSLTDRDLYQLLGRLGERGLPLRSVSMVEPNLEEVFLQLMHEEASHV